MSDYNRTLEDVWKVIQDETGVMIDTAYRTEYVNVWREWFEGYRTGFHSYTESVLGINRSFERLSLGAAGKTASAWAELLTREFPIISISDESLQDKVANVLVAENFKEEFVKYLELAFGVGTTGIVEYTMDDGVHIDFLDVDDIVPLSWRNGKVNELATINMFTQEGRYITHIQYMRSVSGNYVLENSVYVSTDENDLGYKVDPSVIGIDDVVYMGVKPFFQLIKPNMLNKIDVDGPLGVSVFSNALSTIKAIDKKYTEFDNEFALGKKRIVVSADALKKKLDTDSGQWVSYMGSDTVYQAVNSDEPLFQAVDFQLREQSYINALNQEFNFLADAVGMDAGSFVFNGVSMKTATEVISEKSKTFGTKQKHDKMIKTVLQDCVWSIIHCIESIEGRKYDVEVSVTMSDAVLIDSQAKKAEELIDVQNGLMPKVIYLQRNYGLSEEDAVKWVELSNGEGFVDSSTLEGMFTSGA